MNERAPQFRDMKNDEDTLIVFVISLAVGCEESLSPDVDTGGPLRPERRASGL